jgi:hypothetical protein
MQSLAKFIMLGRSQAIIVATATAILALILPALGIISAATVALVSLRVGVLEGLIVTLASSLASALLTQMMSGNALPALLLLVILWLPMLILGALLRESRSLSLVTQVGLGTGGLFILLLYTLLEDPQLLQTQILQSLAQELTQSGLSDANEIQNLMHMIAAWLIGILAAGFYLQVMLSLFLARSWQAHLYNPGGFAAEFHTLRASNVIAVISIPLILFIGYQGATAAPLVRDITVLIMSLWFIQGLAIVHGVVSQAKLHVAWLIGVYAVLLLAPPAMIIFLIIIGLADVWADFRKWPPPTIGPKI